jgi:hypothetical protein
MGRGSYRVCDPPPLFIRLYRRRTGMSVAAKIPPPSPASDQLPTVSTRPVFHLNHSESEYDSYTRKPWSRFCTKLLELDLHSSSHDTVWVVSLVPSVAGCALARDPQPVGMQQLLMS